MTDRTQPFRPQTLRPIPAPFEHPDWIWEIKHDGFRCIAHVRAGRCELVSRNGHTFRSWPDLGREICAALRGRDAVIDGELVCLDADGRSNFAAMMFSAGDRHISTHSICSPSTAKIFAAGRSSSESGSCVRSSRAQPLGFSTSTMCGAAAAGVS